MLLRKPPFSPTCGERVKATQHLDLAFQGRGIKCHAISISRFLGRDTIAFENEEGIFFTLLTVVTLGSYN